MTSRTAAGGTVLVGLGLLAVGLLTAAGVSPFAPPSTSPAARALALRQGVELGLAGVLAAVGGGVFLVDDRLRVGLDAVQRRLFAAGALLAVVGAALALAGVVAPEDWVGALLVALAFETGATLWGVVRQVRRAARTASKSPDTGETDGRSRPGERESERRTQTVTSGDDDRA